MALKPRKFNYLWNKNYKTCSLLTAKKVKILLKKVIEKTPQLKFPTQLKPSNYSIISDIPYIQKSVDIQFQINCYFNGFIAGFYCLFFITQKPNLAKIKFDPFPYYAPTYLLYLAAQFFIKIQHFRWASLLSSCNLTTALVNWPLHFSKLLCKL